MVTLAICDSMKKYCVCDVCTVEAIIIDIHRPQSFIIAFVDCVVEIVVDGSDHLHAIDFVLHFDKICVYTYFGAHTHKILID